MAYPYDDNDDELSYTYGLSEKQIRERMNYAIHGDEDDDIELDFGDLNDDDSADDDDE
jgi:hypothetical protein